jgi:hypothetical protein
MVKTLIFQLTAIMALKKYVTISIILIIFNYSIHIRTMASLLKGPNTYINGEWVGASSKQTFEVKNPANGKVIASVPDMSSEDANSAIDAARKVPYKKFRFIVS